VQKYSLHVSSRVCIALDLASLVGLIELCVCVCVCVCVGVCLCVLGGSAGGELVRLQTTDNVRLGFRVQGLGRPIT
jgi:hypothetical protein